MPFTNNNTVGDIESITYYNKEYHKLIYDKLEIRKFYNIILPDLDLNELYFVSLSARNKYLTEDERKEYGLGRTEMFEKRIIKKKEWNRFFRTIKKFECAYGAYTTRYHIPIPDKCMVIYININPSNVLKAWNDFQKVYNNYIFELANNISKKKDTKNIGSRLLRIESTLQTSLQKSRGVKHWIDIDCDVPHNDNFMTDLWNKIVIEKREGQVRSHIIKTKGGYHILINAKDLYFNPNDIVTELLTEYLIEYPNFKGEIILNSNAMIPLPGTLQAGYPVTILNSHIDIN